MDFTLNLSRSLMLGHVVSLINSLSEPAPKPSVSSVCRPLSELLFSTYIVFSSKSRYRGSSQWVSFRLVIMDVHSLVQIIALPVVLIP